MFRQMAPDGIINKEIVEYNTEAVKQNEVKNSEATVTSSGASVNRDVSGQSVEPVKTIPSSLAPPQDQDQVVSPGAMSIDKRKSPSFEKEKQSDETSALGSIVAGVQAALSVSSDKSFENVGTKDIDDNYDPKHFSDIELEASRSISSASGEGKSTLSGQEETSMIGASTNPTKQLRASESAAQASIYSSAVNGTKEVASASSNSGLTEQLENSTDQNTGAVQARPRELAGKIQPGAGKGVAVPPHSDEARAAHEEMSRITPLECPFMNRE